MVAPLTSLMALVMVEGEWGEEEERGPAVSSSLETSRWARRRAGQGRGIGMTGSAARGGDAALTRREAKSRGAGVARVLEREVGRVDNGKIESTEYVLIIRGGPTGVELAGEIVVDYPGKRVTLIHRGSRLLEFIGDKASKKCLDWLTSKKVDVLLQQSVDLGSLSDTKKVYKTSGGETVTADCHFLCIGKPLSSSWLHDTILKESLDSKGRVMVEKDLRVKGFNNIFAIGDITDIPLLGINLSFWRCSSAVGSEQTSRGSSLVVRTGATNHLVRCRLRGLPFDCNDIDICKFFVGLDIVDCLLVNKNGRFTGEAFVVFPTAMQTEFALHRNRQNMGRRYVDVFRCKKLEYYRAIANEVSQGGYFESKYRRSSPPLRPPKKPAEDKGSMEYTEVLKLRGLPYSATTEDIIKFFLEYELTEENVHIAINSYGKATGEAFVEFPIAEVAKTAMCKDKMTIGTRYVELFPSTPEEASRARTRGRH
ncbi:Epithelial splicing regulatory protein 2 [Zea mays]|uniref:Epithelial splicing regulatory protein 2 n=1 Tax=Zea mays TaxID=4577 RepID=A0A3L6EFX3_MAIZE|nr:Epithelial splicing regulatory protein 2 [Zea mays]